MEKFKMKYQIGQTLEDGYVYAGEMLNHETGEAYGLAVAPKDEPGEMSWNEAIKLPIQTSKEGSLIFANLGHLFNGGWYWSSTEYNNGISWVQRFNDGNQAYDFKYDVYRVRCVRRLTLSSFDSLPAKKDSRVLKELKKTNSITRKDCGSFKMSEVKRYSFDEICDSQDFNHEEKFILASDYEKLKAQLERADNVLEWFNKRYTGEEGIYAREYFKEKGPI